MQLTKFEKLKLVISEYGANPVIANLDKQLTVKGISVDEHQDRMVIGENGIYYVDPDGALTKVIIHIVDNNIGPKYASGLKEFIQNGDFESAYVLDKVHKYHLMKCQVIERAEKEGWRKHKYRMSRRQDGRFFYRYLDKNEVLIEKEDQALFACKVCLKELGGVTGHSHSRETFDLGDFLSSSFKDIMSVDKSGEYANDCAPNVYKKDWHAISRSYKKLKHYHLQIFSLQTPIHSL